MGPEYAAELEKATRATRKADDQLKTALSTKRTELLEKIPNPSSPEGKAALLELQRETYDRMHQLLVELWNAEGKEFGPRQKCTEKDRLFAVERSIDAPGFPELVVYAYPGNLDSPEDYDPRDLLKPDLAGEYDYTILIDADREETKLLHGLGDVFYVMRNPERMNELIGRPILNEESDRADVILETTLKFLENVDTLETVSQACNLPNPETGI
ncbi:MAG TPA: hypothetical protein VD947_00180 [Patescibacteria group bacterium]|nr:hypothetical protein [Patescibacteria group bacterium]